MQPLIAVAGSLAQSARKGGLTALLQRASYDSSELAQHRTSGSPKESIGRWRRDLPAGLSAVCQQAFGDILKEFGYLP